MAQPEHNIPGTAMAIIQSIHPTNKPKKSIWDSEWHLKKWLEKKNKAKNPKTPQSSALGYCLSNQRDGLCFLSAYVINDRHIEVGGRRGFCFFLSLWPRVVALLALFHRQDGAVVLRHCFAQLTVCWDRVSPWHQRSVSLQGRDSTPELLSQTLLQGTKFDIKHHQAGKNGCIGWASVSGFNRLQEDLFWGWKSSDSPQQRLLFIHSLLFARYS